MKYVVVMLCTVVLLFPLAYMMSGSLRPLTGVLAIPPQLVPTHITLDNYVSVFAGRPWGPWIMNTMIVVGGSVVFGLLVALVTGYALAILDSRFSRIMRMLTVVSLMIPRTLLFLPLFVVMKEMHLGSTRIAALLPVVWLPIGILWIEAVIRGLPRSLLDAARIDGASEGRIMISVVLPQLLPPMAVLGILQAHGTLQDYMWQAIQLRGNKSTLIVGLLQYVMDIQDKSVRVNPIGKLLAVGTFMFLLTFAVYVIGQRWFAKGMGVSRDEA